MTSIPWTEQQREAIETTGRSMLVTAAAGAGKTAVLAQRCAYLVCDAPAGQRCNVDELLVLTFTNAAAAEMRSRIVEAIRQRLQERPENARLHEQVALVDAAQISTIHSFCLWMLRRWFSEIGIDPNATVLDEEEASLLRREVLDELFSDLYARDDRLAQGFRTLVERYGLGNDRDIAKLTLQLHAFVGSLPDPDEWLREARESIEDEPDRVVVALFDDMREELDRQEEHCEQAAAMIESGDAVGGFYASEIRSYIQQLRAWAEHCPAKTKNGASTEQRTRALKEFESVRPEIAAYEFSKKRGPRLPKDSDPALLQARDAARDRLKHVKEHLFRDRLKNRFALFSVEEWLDGLRRIAPHVSTIVDLVTTFDASLLARKKKLDVLGFSDLERFAFRLLIAPQDPAASSDVARSLQRRFAYVLVDEFQDINPIQRAIIERVSRETNSVVPDNLFVVGDVKQSIYRFRLAEPDIFLKRLRDSRSNETSYKAIALQANFRSRPEILDAVNLVFGQLMTSGAGDIVYDKDARLCPGRNFDSARTHVPIELHLLERNVDGNDETDEATGSAVPGYLRSRAWSSIEREGYLIGKRIQEWMSSEARDPFGRQIAYQDVAVLLRTARINAERIAATLNAMGIPAHTDTGGSLFAALEIRDVLAALNVLDNTQQDISLAAVLRSGILGDRFSEDELVEVRCIDREAPFHECLCTYAETGTHDALRHRLQTVLDSMTRYRAEFRRRPLPRALWSLYERQGVLAHAAGLPNGVQRHANLLKLHEMARKFGTFRRQGLSRFLQFVESVDEEGRDIATAPPASRSDDAVRVMSIHKAKGLEFPIVFVAGLGTRFNLGDRNGRMIYERKAKLGLRVVDTNRMITYPSAAHHLVASRIERVTREEELRILYVAMTRAQEKLVLVASAPGIDQYRETVTAYAETFRPSLLTITSAMKPLDWLIPAFAAAPAGMVRGLGGSGANRPIVDVSIHEASEIAEWTLDQRMPGDETIRMAVAEGRSLPLGEPYAPDDLEVERIQARIEYVYPALAAGTLPAVIAASEFKPTLEDVSAWTPTEHASEWIPAHAATTRSQRFPIPQPGHISAAEGEAVQRGLLTHTVLQHLDFYAAARRDGVASELQRMVASGLITSEGLALLDQASLDWFVATPLAHAMRDAGDAYYREFQFVATEPTSYIDPSSGPAAGDVLIRGVVDGILADEEAIEIVDFKTDTIDPEEVARRLDRYRPQMQLYARAMARIWRKPIRSCRLVFLNAQRVVELRDLALD